MFYEYNLTVPKNTAETSPKTKSMKVWAGVVHRVAVMFPNGPSGLLRCRIMQGSHTLWPSNPDGYFGTDGETVDFLEYFEIESRSIKFRLEAWNLDDTYEHSVFVRLGVLPKDKLLIAGAYENVLGVIKNITLRK